MTAFQDEDGAGPLLVPARMVNEMLYCERLCYLEWRQGEWADNRFTVDGKHVHRRVDQPSAPLVAPEEAPDERPYQARSIALSSERLGLTAKVDLVEVEGGRAMVVEYKRGKKPDVAEGAYLPERAQVAAHVMLLREHGFECDTAEIYFAGSKTRVPIRIDDELMETTIAAARRAQSIPRWTEMPPPLVDSPKCNGCSLAGICLPDEVHLLQRSTVFEVEDEETTAKPEARRLYPARDDRMPLYLQEQGSRLSVSGECLIAKSKAGESTEVRLMNTSQVSVFGNVSLTTPAIRALFESEIPLFFFSYGGWLLGRATGLESKNVDLRLAQYRATLDPARSLELARGLVRAKILNCRTLHRRNARGADVPMLKELRIFSRKAWEAPSLESLLGIEGSAARYYFQSFARMLNPPAQLDAFQFERRNRRPPTDPVNTLLSFCYSLLTKEMLHACQAVGLDPLLGFYHRPHFGRPGLALDLMEEFRPLIADSIVINVINTGVVTASDFVVAAGGCTLTAAGRRSVIAAFERRLDQLVTHPLFEYRVSYRRLLELQARLLTRWLLGEIPRYPSFQTR